MADQETLTPEQTIELLDNLDATDPEEAHAEADAIISSFVPPEVYAAYERVIERAGSWWFA